MKWAMDADSRDDFVQSTKTQALYLWIGLCLALTLFFVQSQMFFVKTDPLPSQSLEWVFAFLGLVTFLFGYFFYRAYISLRRKQIMQLTLPDRKQSVLVAFVLQYVLFETLGLYGVLLSVLMQNTVKAIPFVLFAYLGFVLSFPKKEKIQALFE
ncbi:MAG: hypothetical protein KDD33_11480 [Bdellovibrionales bacterium]|nr:hypothetical protein [Bdellovibrionales bacterium]